MKRKFCIISIALTLAVCFASVPFSQISVSAFNGVSVSYSAHVSTIGWMSQVGEQHVAGTENRSLAIEAMQISINNAPSGGYIAYGIHVADYGWLPDVTNGQMAGTTGESKSAQAICIAVHNMPGWNVYYRVHMHDIGWGDWVTNGNVAGTVGESRPIEAIQIFVTYGSATQAQLNTADIYRSEDTNQYYSFITWPNNAKMIDGVGSYGSHTRRYWIDSSASGHTDLINQAASEWVNTNSILRTSISLAQTSTQSSSVIDIDEIPIPNANNTVFFGRTDFFNSQNNEISPTIDYNWTQIHLNSLTFELVDHVYIIDQYTGKQKTFDDFQKKATIAHEMGHCMGLAHTIDSNRIMSTFGGDRNVNRATWVDLRTINYLYD